MRRKNRKWVAIAGLLYLFVMWSAYRWGIAQRMTDGNIFDRIERESSAKRLAELAQEEAAQPKPMGESRLTAAGPAFMAARYDAAHVVFMFAAETESRFAASSNVSGKPVKIPMPLKGAAPLAGFQELWEPDSQSLHFFPEIVQKTQRGEQWFLNLSPDSTIPVVIDRAVIAPMGCSLSMGFLASVPPAPQGSSAFRRQAVESVDPPVIAHIAELREWKPSPATTTRIERQLTERMKQEVERFDARLVANAGSPGATAGESPVGHAQPRLKEWIHADRGLMRGEGLLDYDVRAFRLTPDGAPRLFVRARWKRSHAPVFLMSAWFRADSFGAESMNAGSGTAPAKNASVRAHSAQVEASTVLLSADSSWSLLLREGAVTGNLGDRLDFQTILNEFDADHDGWWELLINSDQGASTTITLFLYTDLGLVPMK